MSDVVSVDDNNFETEVLKAKVPVIVDFSATWCGPCQRQMPIMEKFASDNTSVKVVTIDIDDSPTVTSKYGIKSVPSILLFNNGERVDMKVGLTAAASLKSWMLEKVG